MVTMTFLEAIDEASLTTQVLATTHGPSIPDDEGLDIDMVRAVVIDHGRTTIGPIESGSRRLLDEHLYGVGELLRRRAALRTAISVGAVSEDGIGCLPRLTETG